MAIRKINSRAISDGAVATADLDDNPLTIDSLTVDTNTLVVDAANNRVGVGTASPTAQFDVTDASGNEPTIKLSTSAATNYLSIARDSSTGHYEFKSEETGSSISFHTDPDGSGPVDRFHINRYGNIGIGETSPDDDLTIGGETTVYGTALQGHKLGLRAGVVGGTTGDSVKIASFAAESTNNNTFGASVQGYRRDTGNDWTTTAVKFNYNVDNSTIYDGLLSLSGNGRVGIRTVDPDNTLHVAGSTKISGTIYGDGASTGYAASGTSASVTGLPCYEGVIYRYVARCNLSGTNVVSAYGLAMGRNGASFVFNNIATHSRITMSSGANGTITITNSSGTTATCSFYVLRIL